MGGGGAQAPCNVRSSNVEAANEVSSVPSVVLPVCLVFVMVDQSSRRKGWACGCHICFEAPPPGNDVLWSVDGGAAIGSVASR